MHPFRNQNTPAPDRVSQVATPSLLNECYTRLKACAEGLQHACQQKGVSGLHAWMRSFGTRLESMADVLHDEGARPRAIYAKSAAKLHLEKTCSSPGLLLEVIERIQLKIMRAYDELSLRLDMDEELYDVLVEQSEELREVLEDMRVLRLEYEAYGEA